MESTTPRPDRPPSELSTKDILLQLNMRLIRERDNEHGWFYAALFCGLGWIITVVVACEVVGKL